MLMTPVSKFDEAVPVPSGTASGVWGLGLPSSLLRRSLCLCPPSLPPSWAALFRCSGRPVAAASLAAMLVYAALSGVYVFMPAATLVDSVHAIHAATSGWPSLLVVVSPGAVGVRNRMEEERCPGV